MSEMHRLHGVIENKTKLAKHFSRQYHEQATRNKALEQDNELLRCHIRDLEAGRAGNVSKLLKLVEQFGERYLTEYRPRVVLAETNAKRYNHIRAGEIQSNMRFDVALHRAAAFELMRHKAQTVEGINDVLRYGAHTLLNHLEQKGDEPPNGIYPLPDGNPMLEWHKAHGVIERIEVTFLDHGQKMVSYADGMTTTTFEDVTW